MKNVRVFYKKKSRMKFISHLDMNRFMTRMLRRTNIPIWYTEGFNTHAYITFALPLSLGFESEYEIMDFKVIDDEYCFDQVVTELKAVMPEYIEVISAAEPVLKVGKVAFAEFKIVFEDNTAVADALREFLKQDEILSVKTNKKGVQKTVNIAEKLNKWQVSVQKTANITENAEERQVTETGNTVLTVTLPAGAENINPVLLLNAFEEVNGKLPYYSIMRTKILDENMHLFK